MTTNLQEFREQFFHLAQNASTIVITSHMSPDDDSIGSVLLMYVALTEKFPEKNIRIIYTGRKAERYNIFYNVDKIEWVDDVANDIDGVDMLITLDASNMARFSKQPEKLAAIPIRVGLDHHPSEPDGYSLLLHDKHFSSNAELVYRVFFEDQPLTKEVAELVLLGVLGDTGGFAYVKPHQSEVFTLAKKLIDTVGMPIDQFRSRYMAIPLRIIPLLQELVQHTAYETIAGWPPMQYAYIARETMQRGDYTDEDMSAASHIYMSQYLPRIEGYGWGIVVTPRTDGGCRQSGRSLPTSVNVRDLHERLGVGSGHDRAAGGAFAESDPKACIAKVLAFMQSEQPLIG